MTNYNRQVPTVFLPQTIAQAGKRAHELTPYTIGIIDCETNLTVDAATYSPDKKYEIILKKGDTGMDNAMFPDIRGARLPVRLPVTNVYKAHSFNKGSEKPKNFVAYWGWDGISDCKTISLECGQDYALQITVRGESIRNVFHRNLTELIPFKTGCCDDCNLDASCDNTVDTILKALKGTYKTPGTKAGTYYVMDYIDVNKVKSCCPEEDPFDKKEFKTWTITLCDNGTVSDLAKLQRQYPDYTITCIDRDAPQSTYEISCIPAGETPDDYIQKNIKALVCDECPTCPDSFTKVEGGDKLIACFDTAAAAGVTTLEEFTLDYYADETTAQATIDALVETAAGNLPGYVATTATVLGATCEKLTLQVCVTEGTEITEHGVAEVTLDKIGECTGKCEGESTTPWCPGEDLYKISRTKCITIKKDDCTEGVAIDDTHPLYKEVFDLIKDVEDIDPTTFAVKSDNDCLVTFTVDQCSNCVSDGCDTYGKDGAKFHDNFPTYKGVFWTECGCEGWTFDVEGCPVAPATAAPDNCLCGLKFEGKYVNPETAQPCSYDIGDNIEREPVEIEVTLIRQYGDSDICNPLEIDWTVVQYPTIAEGLGQFVKRKEVLSRKYDLGMYFNPKGEYGNLFQSKTGYEYAAKPNKRYNHLDIYFTSDTERNFYRHDSPIRNLLQLYVEADNVVLFDELKTFLNKTFLKHGLCKLL